MRQQNKLSQSYWQQLLTSPVKTVASKIKICWGRKVNAVRYENVCKISVSDYPKPKLVSPTDAILKVTTSGISGSDLHMYDGRTELKQGTVVGHEILGVIEEIGQAVRSVSCYRSILPMVTVSTVIAVTPTH